MRWHRSSGLFKCVHSYHLRENQHTASSRLITLFRTTSNQLTSSASDKRPIALICLFCPQSSTLLLLLLLVRLICGYWLPAWRRVAGDPPCFPSRWMSGWINYMRCLPKADDSALRALRCWPSGSLSVAAGRWRSTWTGYCACSGSLRNSPRDCDAVTYDASSLKSCSSYSPLSLYSAVSMDSNTPNFPPSAIVAMLLWIQCNVFTV